MTADASIRHVSDTAFMIAHHRAVESARPDALFRDPLAVRLAGERGPAIADAFPTRAMTGWLVAVRTVVIDDFVRDAISKGVDVVVNLGAGLDTRPYRMDLPPSLTFIEADYPEVLAYKEKHLATEVPRCRLIRVGVDLADAPARQAFLSTLSTLADPAGLSDRHISSSPALPSSVATPPHPNNRPIPTNPFDPSARANPPDPPRRRALILTEGLVPYLDLIQAASLADDLSKVPEVDSWIVDYISPEGHAYRQRAGIDQRMQNAAFKFQPPDWFAFFASHGWRPRQIRYLPEEGARLNRPPPFPFPTQTPIPPLAPITTADQRASFERSSGYVLLEPATS